MRRIAVIGAGAAGACLVESLGELVSEPCDLTVVDGAPFLWRGRAYQPDARDVITNIPASHMSVRASDPAHALRRLTARTPGCVDAQGLTARSLYGGYLAETLTRTLRRLFGRGWRLRTVRTHARRLVPEDDGVRVVTESGAEARFDHVVLCAGPASPPDPYRLAATPRWIAVPFPLARMLRGIGPDDRVGVLGSGLTAVDVVAALAARGHRGPVVLASRSGLLPAVAPLDAPPPLRHLTLTRLEGLTASGRRPSSGDLRALLAAELHGLGCPVGALRHELAADRPPFELLRRRLAGPDGHDAALAVLRQALPRFAGQAWSLLPEDEQTALWERHGRAVTSLCCPMPRHRAELLLRLHDAGRLRAVSGLSRVDRAPGGGFDLVTDGTEHRVDVLVNALNPGAPGGAAPSTAEASVAALPGAAHPLGGLRTDRRTHRVAGTGDGPARLYALGHATRGAVLFHFGMPSLVYQSGLVACALAAEGGPSRGGRAVSAAAH
ncbi:MULTISPECIES: FAD/NAD(P)-binding protein [Streptomyces]|uniref:FAD/NAD(P)-binding protein n=1 Tax=Streptomyces TaxID=1883 RepID=UPI00163B769F|nr:MULTISPECIES: FAD/NAD(P)-binding protein [Streptomyces]MBC2875507.1 FAD/NAD(P)-binding protein [Streptomyces sp. TYQ1024]UBI35745.1 FAD/NAD(P)-binding protein [Streptomyces mobaraensis]UKW28338.1 FAD/NAD(P)-binding protein [Streptomyces sp. TYQ1024]